MALYILPDSMDHDGGQTAFSCQRATNTYHPSPLTPRLATIVVGPRNGACPLIMMASTDLALTEYAHKQLFLTARRGHDPREKNPRSTSCCKKFEAKIKTSEPEQRKQNKNSGKGFFSNGDTNNLTSAAPHSYMQVPQICNTSSSKVYVLLIGIQLDHRSWLTVHPKWCVLDVRKAA